MKPFEILEGFSSLNRGEKQRVAAERTGDPATFTRILDAFRNKAYGEILDQFSENTVSHYPLPYGLIPNVVVNGKLFLVPAVTEESSVIAAASGAAKFWARRGGFQARVTGMIKEGQVYFRWQGEPEHLQMIFNKIQPVLNQSLKPFVERMEQRGGGIRNMELIHAPEILKDCYQLRVQAETADAMGANWMNTLLEELAIHWKKKVAAENRTHSPDILMSILSNFTPESRVKVSASCPVSAFKQPGSTFTAEEIAGRLVLATRIAREDPYRAVTHNKGIYNGIDAVALATGNDFRAIEACGHAWACRDGRYRGLTEAKLESGIFRISLEVPFAAGTTGGLTTLHPLAAQSMKLLGSPSASELMEIMASVGLASNFAAMKSLVTGGIQKGHMKMHLKNLLLKHGATSDEQQKANVYFRNHPVTDRNVYEFLVTLRTAR